jgi:hypothetical protein
MRAASSTRTSNGSIDGLGVAMGWVGWVIGEVLRKRVVDLFTWTISVGMDSVAASNTVAKGTTWGTNGVADRSTLTRKTEPALTK